MTPMAQAAEDIINWTSLKLKSLVLPKDTAKKVTGQPIK
jgi:hypothetical protein